MKQIFEQFLFIPKMFDTSSQKVQECGRWYRLDVDEVTGTPINQYESGFDTQNTTEWARTFEFTVTTNTPANIMFVAWSDSNDTDSGFNFFEISKLN